MAVPRAQKTAPPRKAPAVTTPMVSQAETISTPGRPLPGAARQVQATGVSQATTISTPARRPSRPSMPSRWTRVSIRPPKGRILSRATHWGIRTRSGWRAEPITWVKERVVKDGKVSRVRVPKFRPSGAVAVNIRGLRTSKVTVSQDIAARRAVELRRQDPRLGSEESLDAAITEQTYNIRVPKGTGGQVTWRDAKGKLHTARTAPKGAEIVSTRATEFIKELLLLSRKELAEEPERRSLLATLQQFRRLPTQKQFAAGGMPRGAEGAMPGGYDLAAAIGAGVTVARLRQIFRDPDVDAAVETHKYNIAPANEKFRTLQKQGLIPAGAKFSHVDDEGYVHYYAKGGVLSSPEAKKIEKEFLEVNLRERNLIIGTALRGEPRRPTTISLEELARIKRDDPAAYASYIYGDRGEGRYGRLPSEQKLLVLSYYHSLEPKKVGLITIPKEKIPEFEGAVLAGKVMLAPIPLIGTAAWWSDMSPTWKGISVALDILIIGSILRPGLILRSLMVATGKSTQLQRAEKLYRAGLRTSKATLRRLDKRLVRPFEAMARSQKAYADNLAVVADLQKAAKGTKGEVLPEILRALDVARKKTPALLQKFKDAAQEFSRIQLKAARAGYDDVPLVVSEFPKRIAADTKAAIDMAFDPMPKIGQARRTARRALTEFSTAKKNQARLIELYGVLPSKEAKQILNVANTRVGQASLELATANARLAIVQSGKVRQLHSKLVAVLEEVDEVKKLLRKTKAEQMRTPFKERDYPSMIWRLETRLKNLAGQQKALNTKLRKAFNTMEALWYKPLSRGGGNVLVMSGKPSPPRGGGVGRVSAPSEVPLLEPAIATTGITGVGRPYQVVWVPPSVYPRVVGELREALGNTDVITKPRPETLPWVVWPDEEPDKVRLRPVVIRLPDPLAALRIHERYQRATEAAVSAAIKAAPATKGARATRVATTVISMTGTTAKVRPSLAPALATGTATVPDVLRGTRLTPARATPVPVTPKTPVKDISLKAILAPPPVISRLVSASPGGTLIPAGSIAWKQGLFWKYIPPPWGQSKPITLSAPPRGALHTGSDSPQATIQVIGRSRKTRVPKEIEIDLGWADIRIVNGTEIYYKSGGEWTNTGTRIDSPTRGMSVEGSVGRLFLETGLTPGTPASVSRSGSVNRPAMSKKKPKRKRVGKREDWLEDLVGLKGFRP